LHSHFEASTNATGWAQLSLTSSPQQSNKAQAYGAGYLEGYLTADLIWMSWNSTVLRIHVAWCFSFSFVSRLLLPSH
jgi:hypothetical protein